MEVRNKNIFHTWNRSGKDHVESIGADRLYTGEFMNSSCISFPANNPSVNISDWQLKATGNNHCAAGLISLFISYINNENGINDYHQKFTNDKNVSQSITSDGIPLKLSVLKDALFGLWAERKISEALETLKSINFISIQRNPDPAKIFDRTNFIRFYPENCNQWIRENYDVEGKFIGSQNSSLENVKKVTRKSEKADSKTPKGILETVKKENQECQKTVSSDENDGEPKNITQVVDLIDNAKRQSRESEKADSIMPKGALYINNKNKYQSIQSININQIDNENLNFSKKQTSEKHERIIAALTAKGFSSDKFKYPDAIPAVNHLLDAGATLEMFEEAYETSCKATSGNGFGVKYLVKVVESQLAKSKRLSINNATSGKRNSNKSQNNTVSTPNYSNDFKNAMPWAADIIG